MNNWKKEILEVIDKVIDKYDDGMWSHREFLDDIINKIKEKDD